MTIGWRLSMKSVKNSTNLSIIFLNPDINHLCYNSWATETNLLLGAIDLGSLWKFQPIIDKTTVAMITIIKTKNPTFTICTICKLNIFDLLLFSHLELLIFFITVPYYNEIVKFFNDNKNAILNTNYSWRLAWV